MPSMYKKKRGGGRTRRTTAGDLSQLAFRLPSALYNKVTKRAKADKVTKSEIIRQALELLFVRA